MVIYIKSNYFKKPSTNCSGKMRKYLSIFAESHSKNINVHKVHIHIPELNIESRPAKAESKLSLEAESLKN